MKKNKNILEKEAKKFLESRFISGRKKVNNINIYPSDKKYIPLLNYLAENGYIVEKGESVKDFHYLLTQKGKELINFEK